MQASSYDDIQGSDTVATMKKHGLSIERLV